MPEQGSERGDGHKETERSNAQAGDARAREIVLSPRGDMSPAPGDRPVKQHAREGTGSGHLNDSDRSPPGGAAYGSYDSDRSSGAARSSTRRHGSGVSPGPLVVQDDYARQWAIDRAEALREERLLAEREAAKPARRSSWLPGDIDTSLVPGLELESSDDEPEDSEASERWLTVYRSLGVVVTVDVLALWAETDRPDVALWWELGHCFLLVYIVELGMNAYRFGGLRKFYKRFPFWSVYESCIVVLGIGELWLVPILELLGWRLTGWRLVLKLLRTLRMGRVFRLFDALHDFGNALLDMAGTFILVFLVMLVTLSSCAVMFVHLMGHGEMFSEAELADRELEQLRRSFADVGGSLFTLFQFTTQDNWAEVAHQMISIGSYWRIFFVAFIPFASWTMLAMMSAEASNCMIEATASRKEESIKLLEHKHHRFITFLRNAFLDADMDGNGMLDMDEFNDMMQKEEVQIQMKELGVSHDEARELFNLLDVDDSGELTIDEFVDGLGCLQEGLSTEHIVNVDYSLKRVEKRVEGGMQEVREAMDEITTQHARILGQLSHHERLHEAHRPLLIHFHKWAANRELDGEIIQLPTEPDQAFLRQQSDGPESSGAHYLPPE